MGLFLFLRKNFLYSSYTCEIIYVMKYYRKVVIEIIDKKALRIKMMEHGDRQSDLAEAMEISLSRFSAKINGYHGAQFTMSEMVIVKERYSLTPEEFVNIFMPIEIKEG